MRTIWQARASQYGLARFLARQLLHYFADGVVSALTTGSDHCEQVGEMSCFLPIDGCQKRIHLCQGVTHDVIV